MTCLDGIDIVSIEVPTLDRLAEVALSIDNDARDRLVDITHLLLAFESCLEQLNQLASLSLQPSTNMATYGSSTSAKKILPDQPSASDRGSWRGSREFRS